MARYDPNDPKHTVTRYVATLKEDVRRVIMSQHLVALRDYARRVVQDGEWAGSIALQYGFTAWNTRVWNAPQNTELGTKRPDPQVLASGGECFIPARDDKQGHG